jgi:hypothetical protein
VRSPHAYDARIVTPFGIGCVGANQLGRRTHNPPQLGVVISVVEESKSTPLGSSSFFHRVSCHDSSETPNIRAQLQEPAGEARR